DRLTRARGHALGNAVATPVGVALSASSDFVLREIAAWVRHHALQKAPRASFSSSSRDRRGPKPRLQALPVAEVRTHEDLPELSVVRHREVEQFVNDHVVLEVRVKIKQISTERKVSCSGARSPLARHGSDVDRERLNVDVKFARPAVDPFLERAS